MTVSIGTSMIRAIHYWFDHLRSNLVLPTASESNPAGTPASTNKSTASAHVNLIWSPVANSDLGKMQLSGADKGASC